MRNIIILRIIIKITGKKSPRAVKSVVNILGGLAVIQSLLCRFSTIFQLSQMRIIGYKS
ncbi:hypothetical protein HMPREF0454_01304 [Hafnia alvei ATCC 51873]|uniref:Uncharacterized protein n=1 Tax=Hafnia alvei ATCC 51873 TaxID=1002364 RepID=G9Y424_HAFAL|nr:hypothetical protein HMPREF0454_01304 [Hafnia alvei ATCC 51873]